MPNQHREQIKQTRQQTRLFLIMEMIKELFDDRQSFVQFEGSKITITNKRETLKLTSFYNQICKTPHGMIMWTNPAKEIVLSNQEEEYINFSLKMYLRAKSS